MVSSLRYAASGCVIATGLLLSGAGAIAVAAADSHGSGTNSHGGGAGSSQGGASASGTGTSPAPGAAGGTATGAAGNAATSTASGGNGSSRANGGMANSLRTTLDSFAGALGSGQIVGPQPSTVVIGPKTTPSATEALDAKKGGGLAIAGPTAVVPVPGLVTPVAKAAPQAADPAAPATNVLGAAPGLAAPIRDVIAVVPNLVPAPIRSLVASSVPLLIQGGTDFILIVEDILIAPTQVEAPPTQLSSDFWSLLGIDTSTAAGTVVGPQAVNDAMLPAPAAAPVPMAPVTVSRLLLPVPLSDVTPSATAGAPSVALPLSAAAAPMVQIASPARTPAHDDSGLASLPAHIFQAVREALRSVSLAELAAAALPGIGGLVFFTAGGVGVGRRQAKAGFALQVSGIARFARSGPLGIVRSDSLIAIHRRKPGAERRRKQAA